MPHCCICTYCIECCIRRADSIIKDSTYPFHGLFSLIQLEKRYRSTRTRSTSPLDCACFDKGYRQCVVYLIGKQNFTIQLLSSYNGNHKKEHNTNYYLCSVLERKPMLAYVLTETALQSALTFLEIPSWFPIRWAWWPLYTQSHPFTQYEWDNGHSLSHLSSVVFSFTVILL